MPRRFVLVATALVMAAPAAAAPPSEVVVIGSMHGLHAKSKLYSYDDLYGAVRRFHPDYVGVEIRSEDMARDQAYLEKNYPIEMIRLAQEWGSRAFGFDWLGDDVAGRAISDDWWTKKSPLKQLERELDRDPKFQSKPLDNNTEERLKIFNAATAESANDGRYDKLTEEYYARFERLVRRSRYAVLAIFYADRDRHLDENVAAEIRAHPGARFAIVTGLDHRGAMIRYLKASLGEAVRFAPVRDR